MAFYIDGRRLPPGDGASANAFAAGGGSGFNTGLTDAFGRQRTSEPFTVFDSKQLFGDPTSFWDTELQGSATSTHSTADAATNMVVTTSGDSVIRQTRMRFNYQPGKSQFGIFTGVMSIQSGTTKRLGFLEGDTSSPYLDPDNGLYFETDGTDMAVCMCKNGSVTKVTQENWNIDKLDGTTSTQIAMDFTKSQIFFIDFEWLGVGRVRFGFFLNGSPYYCHEFLNSNVLPSTYMATPNLPIRYQIESTGGSGNLTHICCTVQSEGGVNPNGVFRSLDSSFATVPFDPVDAGTTAATYPLVAIRLKSSCFGAYVKPAFITTLASTQTNFRWALYFNPTLGSPTWTPLSGSCIEYVVYSGAVTPITLPNLGNLLISGYISEKTDVVNINVESAVHLGAAIDRTPDIFLVAGTPLSSNEDLHGGITWREIA
jgi:hypothetical protein